MVLIKRMVGILRCLPGVGLDHVFPPSRPWNAFARREGS